MKHDTHLKKFSSLVEKRLDELLPLSNDPQCSIVEALRYSLFTPGKRLRPCLLFSTLEGFNIPMITGIDPACSLELVHTYSLVHDDLPCMDNDDFRRGLPSLHKAFTEAQAVLAGDLMLTFAFETLTNSPSISADMKVKLTKVLARRSGLNGMIGGQIVDILNEGKSVSWDLIHFMHLHKTASLITASLEFGGILSCCDTLEMKYLIDCGSLLGVAFQVINDLFDKKGDANSRNSDDTNQKATSVSVLGEKGAQDKALQLLEKAYCVVDNLSGTFETLKYIIDLQFEKTKSFSEDTTLLS